MTRETAIKLFESKKIRSVWDAEKGKWYFSIVDVIEILTESPRPKKYWNALKTKLINEGSELSQKMGQLRGEQLDVEFKSDRRNLFRIKLLCFCLTGKRNKYITF